MPKEKIIHFFFDILIAVLLLLFILSLLWLMNGSLETAPTSEQQDKARVGAILSIIMTGIPCLICVAVRVKRRK